MKKCALTGGIGSGKSTICRIFQTLNVPIFEADREAKKFYLQSDVIQQINNTFGSSVFNNSIIDFKKLSDIVFSNTQALNQLSAIIHPLVMNSYHEWMLQLKNTSYCILESAIIFEANLENEFDYIISVFAPVDLCIQRIIERDSTDYDHVTDRMRAQIDPEEKRKKSDFEIVNDDYTMVLPQVLKIHNDMIRN